MPPTPTASRGDRLMALVKSAQFVWWLGHLSMLICTSLYVPYWITFHYRAGGHWFTRAFFGAMVSYGVVVYKSFPNVQFTLEFARRVFSEENVQYFLMAIFWWRSTPMLAPLVPYAVFAFFNSLNFMRGNLIPVLVPEPPAGTTDALYAKIQELSQSLQVWTQVNHTGAMAFVAYIEVVGVMGSLIFGAITFQSSFLSPIVYANFLRFRYYYSIHTRTAFALIRARLDNLILPPNGNASIPPAVARGYTLVRDTIIRYGEAPIQQSGGDRDHDRGRPQAR